MTALPSMPASEWAEGMNDILGAHVTRTASLVTLSTIFRGSRRCLIISARLGFKDSSEFDHSFGRNINPERRRRGSDILSPFHRFNSTSREDSTVQAVLPTDHEMLSDLQSTPWKRTVLPGFQESRFKIQSLAKAISLDSSP
ncbi:hypothetical protein C8R47DRAFT_1067639 [Mycena vitilis]|nr:hypothetical protein C8R47DRAFT_1067639 [Mycena vitilis]